YLGALIKYPVEQTDEKKLKRRIDINKSKLKKESDVVIGFIGAGNFAQSYLLPNVLKHKTELKGVATADPLNSKSVAKKFNFKFCTTEVSDVLNDSNINTIFIATRHDTHSEYVINALEKGKHVFVEKPLALNEDQLNEVKKIYENKEDSKRTNLMVGFNRRFSRPFRDIKDFFKERNEPFVICYRVNAGFIPKDKWVQDKEQGGRIIGEGCHFIDVMNFLTGADPVSVFTEAIESDNQQVENYDNVSIVIKYSDGSVGNLLYLANGDSSLPKEYCEVFSGGDTAVMNNFIEVMFYKNNKKNKKSYDGSKGHKEEVSYFLERVKDDVPEELSFHSIYKTTLTTFKIMESLRIKSQIIF
nr:Gfo/Idh/MocA family oxidoreductase [Bacteroidota bacterium]